MTPPGDTATELIHDSAGIDFARPGKHHYRVAFHLDSRWRYSLVPLTVINGLRAPDTDAIPHATRATHATTYQDKEGDS
jgi:hypothetical protein